MIIVAILALLLLPLVVLRGRTRIAYYATDLATWLFALLVWLRVSSSVDPYLFCVAAIVLKLATFSLFLALGRDVRWSANRAAAVAAIVYALAIPAMTRTAIDGDEPFYLLVTESLVRDGDVDLANQYRMLGLSETRRTDLKPQLGDPVGKHGEQYSRTELFLSLLLIPGYAVAGLWGALATIALFGALLVRSTVRWMEDEGISENAMRAVFPFFAFGPPVLFYATRLWPEVPAAFCYVEALRGIRNRRAQRWLPALLSLVLLKLRFLLVAVALLGTPASSRLVRRLPAGATEADRRSADRPTGSRRSVANVAVVIAILVIPLLIAYFVTGDATNVHSWRELIPSEPSAYLRGFFGLLADGMSGIAFQAPFYLFALFAITRWRHTPPGFRDGVLASLLYILYLLPRMEWFGGWAPPLRYLVFVMPVFALGAASVWDKLSRGAIALVAAWTGALVVHGVAYPWRLFHIADGQNPIGEWFSQRYVADFSRLFPSFIRLSDAAWIGAAAVVAIVIFGVRRYRVELAIPLFALAIGLGFRTGLNPASRVHFEDAHVWHDGGRLYPDLYQVMRVAYTGGWVLEADDSLSFNAYRGNWTLHAISGPGAVIELAGRAYEVPSNVRYVTTKVVVPQSGRVTLRCVSGSINVDRMDRDE